MKVTYTGASKTLIPRLGVEVAPGDVIDVPDGFNNANFVPYVSKRKDVKDVLDVKDEQTKEETE